MIRRMREESDGRGGVLRWAFPGGRPRAEESGAECAKREICEETGYIITVVKEISSRTHPQFPTTITYYLCELAMPEPVCGPSEPYEIAVIRWVWPQDVAGLVTSDLEPAVAALLAKRGASEATVAKTIKIGDTIGVRIGENKRELTLIHGDMPLKEGRLSAVSPVGRALLGAQVGDVITYRVGDDLRSLTVLEVK